tara:strand:+ start:319 stop:984 length:666 start_codon:yes stop_codon:yes gene_type:complete
MNINSLENTIKKIKPKYKFTFFMVLLLVLIVGIVTYLLVTYEEQIKLFVDKAGIWGPFIIFLARGISIIFPALPSSIFSIIAGGVFGFKIGYITIILSDLICCQLAFFIARNYGRIPVERLVGKKSMKRLEKFNRYQLEENFFLMTGLLMTGLFDFLSYSIGLGGTRWRTFTPSLIISLLISDSILVAFGAEIGKQIYLVIPLLIAFAFAIFQGLRKKRNA